MKNKYEDVWVFVLSYIFMFFGILFFIGLRIVFDLSFSDIVIILVFGWMTVHSFFLLINILIKYFGRIGK